ncbi:MAG: hypothetical protein M3Q52_05335, partial [Pseudomonadota bacterium]|nr:hypothetical protein [Pseudomonadota bacterium]
IEPQSGRPEKIKGDSSLDFSRSNAARNVGFSADQQKQAVRPQAGLDPEPQPPGDLLGITESLIQKFI